MKVSKVLFSLMVGVLLVSGCSSSYNKEVSYKDAAMSRRQNAYPTPLPANPNGEPYDATYYENYGTNPFIATEDSNVSTFGMDVDTASYTIARRYLHDGIMPDKDSVRTEEFINYFKFAHPESDGNFTISTEGARSRFGEAHYHLLKITVAANEVSLEERKPANMIFVIDVSGSMNREDRLEQVKISLAKLAETLREGDRVGLVVYGSRGRVVSDLTGNVRKIMKAVNSLRPEGSTNAEEGLNLAYRMAHENFEEGKINRIILCSDGVANLGNTSAEDILAQVKRDAEKGITLTALGFGMGNYNDVLMEKLANHGDGNYYYLDSEKEADRILGNGAVSLLQVAGSDAKIQVVFNKDTVDRYRLLGYENRMLDEEDFEDDSVDAGEVGVGQTVTALYELRIKDGVLENPDAEIAEVKIRYLDVDTREIASNAKDVRGSDMNNEFGEATPEFRFIASVAEFAEILKKSDWAKKGSLNDVLETAMAASERLEEANGSTEEIKEFMKLVNATIELAGQTEKEKEEG